MSELIKSIEAQQMRGDRTPFGVGDTVRVFVKVVEGTRERLQAFFRNRRDASREQT